MHPEGQDRVEPGAGQGRQLRRAEEVDLQPGLRAGAVPDGEAAVAVLLGALMVVPDIRAHRVDPDTQQATGPHVGGGRGQVPVGPGAVAVLEDLDTDDQVEPGGR